MSLYGILAFVVVTIFYGSYLIKNLILRRRGIDAARLAKGDKPKSVARKELALSIVTFAMAAVQYFTLFTENEFLSFGMERLPLQLAGLMIASVGTVYFIMAIAAMRSNWRAGIDASQDTELVVTGIYRFSRNPAFVGFDLLYIGFALIHPNIFTILLTVVAIAAFHRQILDEEIYLEGKFGESYSKYRAHTMRY